MMVIMMMVIIIMLVIIVVGMFCVINHDGYDDYDCGGVELHIHNSNQTTPKLSFKL